MSVFFDRRTEQGTITSANPAEVWSDWQGADEHWLFVAPHDDDIVIGGGLTFLAGVQCGVNVSAAVVSNGLMGYCTPEQKDNIVEIRRRETRESFQYLGLPEENLYQFNYADGSLVHESGRRFLLTPNDPRGIEGAFGLQNTLTWLLRTVKPTRIFMPNRLDLHPDHRAVNTEMVISVFHAQGQIWPELGQPIPAIPKLYEYPTYSDFISPPNMRVRVSDDVVEKRLEGVALFKSQLQIDLIVQQLRRAGGNEYLLEMAFDIFEAKKHEHLFG